MSKTMKKTLSIILTILMIVTAVPFAFAVDEYTTVYFNYPEGWTNVNVFYWNDLSSELTRWPGDAMTDEGDGIWSYAISAEAAYVIFNNGSSQTDDIILPTDGKNLYDYESGVWTDYGTTCSHSGGTQTCKGYKCEKCDKWYGEADETAHDWSNLDGICGNCEYACSHANYTDSVCDTCGEKCPHENFSEGKCPDCTAEGKKLTITMNDSYGDGWTGNAVIIEQLVDGEYEEIGTATIDDGKSYTHAEVISEEDIYRLVWDKGSYAYDCSFTVAVDDETVFETDDCYDYETGEILYVICDHIYTNNVCSICGFECGKDYAHIYSSETGICACGSECEHIYKDSEICNVCGMQCPHKEYIAIPLKLTPAIDSASVGVTPSEEIENLFDGIVYTKWCSAFDGNNPPYAVFHFDKAVKLMSYTLITGKDSDLYPERNWVSWTIYGGDSADGEWTVVHQVTDADMPNGYCVETDAFEVNADTAYQYYKLVIDANGGSDKWGCTQQMAEMNIFTDTYIGCADCGEACPHDNYTDGVCDTCGYECPHDNYTKGYCDVCEYPCFHSFTVFNETVAPKCEETGWEESYCDYNCGIKLEQEIPALEHDWVSGGVERPTQNIDGSWSDGYYYDTCKNDATHINITGVAKRGDYDKFNELLGKAKAYYADETLTDEAKEEIAKIINLPVFIYTPQNLIETELSGYINTLDNLVAKVESCLSGTHSFANYEETSSAKCGVNAKETGACSFCGETDVREVEGTALNHSWGEYKSNGDATCAADGTKTASCAHGCGATDTVTDEGSKLPHTDEDGDSICDVCGYDYDICKDCGKQHKNGLQNLLCMISVIIKYIFSVFKA